mmetsp:Transcript_37822/g.119517  ORF Transcript_37822/g.119517 Transcript_37822/m.119517 type:complete len:220 (-) Transcript_37822:192-851(-)
MILEETSLRQLKLHSPQLHVVHLEFHLVAPSRRQDLNVNEATPVRHHQVKPPLLDCMHWEEGKLQQARRKDAWRQTKHSTARKRQVCLHHLTIVDRLLHLPRAWPRLLRARALHGDFGSSRFLPPPRSPSQQSTRAASSQRRSLPLASSPVAAISAPLPGRSLREHGRLRMYSCAGRRDRGPPASLRRQACRAPAPPRQGQAGMQSSPPLQVYHHCMSR